MSKLCDGLLHSYDGILYYYNNCSEMRSMRMGFFTFLAFNTAYNCDLQM